VGVGSVPRGVDGCVHDVKGNRLQDDLKAELVLGPPCVVPLTDSYLHMLQVMLGFCDVEFSDQRGSRFSFQDKSQGAPTL
jgi:hypothetical protein